MVKRYDISLAIGFLAIFAGCSTNPVTDDKSFDSKRTAEIIPIPVDVDTDLTRVYIKKPGDPQIGLATPSPIPDPAFAAAANGAPPAPAVMPARTAARPTKHRRPRTITYRVKPADTLMKISFAVFGDLRRWREISEQNPGKIGKLNSLTPGTTLRIRITNAIDVGRHGDPYLIRRRDTLIKISDHLYGTPRKWWALWDNNRELIHDPNRIYAGFILYYHPDLMKRSFTQIPAEAPALAPAETSAQTKPVVEAPADVAREPANQASESAPALPPSEVPETAPASPAQEAPSVEDVPVSGA